MILHLSCNLPKKKKMLISTKLLILGLLGLLFCDLDFLCTLGGHGCLGGWFLPLTDLLQTISLAPLAITALLP